ncbi:MAG: peptidoglycan DD-metalloendopeptidase family protein [Proteobacteria bacterium]|jgi:murein hydrolase activator|nr:peptidoglycan DD-metalloendopeptidase family protein [Pseudomonadota bacterium]
MPKPRLRCGTLYTTHLCVLLMVCTFGKPAAIVAQQNYASQLSDITGEIKLLQQKLDNSVSIGKIKRDALRKKEQQLADLHKQRSELKHSVSTKSLELTALRDTLTAQIAEQQGQIENLALLVHSGYYTGSENKLKMLLSQRNPYELGRLSNYYRYISKARSERISLLSEETVNVRAAISDYQAQQRELAVEQGRLDALITEANKVSEERSRALLAVNADIASAQQAITVQQEDKARLEKLLSGLDVARTAYKPYAPINAGEGDFSQQKNNLAQPLGGVVLQSFGSRDPITDVKRQGQFIQSKSGEPVHAVYDGEVAFSDWFRGYGQLIILDHGGGYMSLYGHNQELFIGVGDKVSTGQVISTAGESGGIAQAGLYFEIRHNGEPVNPAGWIKG